MQNHHEMQEIEALRIRVGRLNPMEVAQTLKNLMEKFGFTQDQLAKRIGKKRSTIANYLRLLGLPEEIHLSLQSGKISMGHAKALLSIVTAKQQQVLHREILHKNLTVREAEAWARQAPKYALTQTLATDEALHLKDLETRLQGLLGIRVELRGRGTKGQLVLYYEDLDDLDRILAAIGLPAE